MDVEFSDLAVVVPVSFIVQMLPVSVNGFGVREATFAFYFTKVGQTPESALLIPLAATAMVMVFSLSGAAVWFARGHH
jgi:glycosyltransferase 2 family protein